MTVSTSIDDLFAALMGELGKLGALNPTATQRRKREETIRNYIASSETNPELKTWTRFLKSIGAEVGPGGDAALLQKALAQADEHPVTLAAERWLSEVGFDKPYFRLLNRPAGTGPRQPRTILSKHCKEAVAVGPDGCTVAVADGNRVAIYDAVKGTLRKKFKTKHPEEIRRLAIHPDGRQLISGRGLNDSVVRIHDMDTGKQVRTLGGRGDTQDFALSPDGQHVLGGDEALRLWAVDGTAAKPEWAAGDGEGYYTPALTPNGRECVVRVGERLKVYTVGDGSLARTVLLKFSNTRLEDSDREALVLADGKRGLFAVDNGKPVVEVFDLETGAHLKTLEGHSKPVNDLALSPDGNRFATAADDGYVRIWKAQSLECVWAERAHRGAALGVAFLTNDTVVSTGNDGVGRVWDIDEGAPPARSTEPTDNVLVMQTMPDGKHVLVLHDDGVLREWEIATATCSRRFDASKIPPDGNFRLWIASDGATALITRDRNSWSLDKIKPPSTASVFRFDLQTGECRLFYKSKEPSVDAPAVIIDQALYLTTADRGLVRFPLSPDGEVQAESRQKLSDWSFFNHVVVADRWLLACANTNIMSLFDTKMPEASNIRLASTTPGFSFTALCERKEQDRTLVAVASSDTQALLLAFPEGKILRRFGSPAPDIEVDPSGIAFSVDGRTLYTSGIGPNLVESALDGEASESWALPDGPVHAIYAHPSLGKQLVVQTWPAMMLVDARERAVWARWGYSLAPASDFEPSSLQDRYTAIDDGVQAMWLGEELLFLKSIRN
ncbi:WD40 repeat domain-containing protein [Pendulispora rubella]|uniref:WD40 repeat domain-containing protein n=1 Tax=Pendulispora rubella TaxID=2741070 RepID=A0ABZ2LFU4_9BACT